MGLGREFLFGIGLGIATHGGAQEPDVFRSQVRPLIQHYCLDCHSEEKQKGDLDLERFTSTAEAKHDVTAWLSVVDQLELGEMPPQKKPQLSAEEKKALLSWAHGMLGEVAQHRAGDPGPVVLRRLSNAEYIYSIRDLTGVPALDPAKEFPVDGAAGEGFTNAGAALVMSPSLATKYLEAAKGVASHLVLLPDGIGFSPSDMPRDWAEEKLAAIRAIYARYAAPGEESSVNLQGLVFSSKDGGVLPLEKYFAATLEERGALQSEATTIAATAHSRGLSPRYLQTLWEMLQGRDDSSFLLGQILRQWQAAGPSEAPALAASVRQWQRRLWRFNAIGQIGKKDGPAGWQEAVTPVESRQEFRMAVPAEGTRATLVERQVSSSGQAAHWENVRLSFADGQSLPLAEAEPCAQ